MSENKDYAQLTRDELLIEEKKIKRMELVSAVVIGFLLGIMIYGTVRKGFGFLHIFIPLLLISGIVKNSKSQRQKLNEIREEINAKTPE